MLDHVSLGVKDLERSRRFYDAALHPLGLVRTVDFQGRGSDYGAMAGQFGVEFTITVETGVSPLPGMHLCFRAPNRASVGEFHAAALTAGGHDDGGLGFCARSITPTTTRAFVVDPDGHRIEAVSSRTRESYDRLKENATPTRLRVREDRNGAGNAVRSDSLAERDGFEPEVPLVEPKNS